MFPFLGNIQTDSEYHPPFYLLAFDPLLKWPELQADHFLHLVSRLRMSRSKTVTLTKYILDVHSLPCFNKCTLKGFSFILLAFSFHIVMKVV